MGNFFLDHDRIFLPTGINGVEGFTFLLDTGGGVAYASITPECLNELKSQQLKVSKQWRSSRGMGGKVDNVGKIKGMSLRVGDFTIQNINVPITKIGIKGPIIDGYINNRILRDFKITIDFVKMQITLKKN